MFLTDSKINKSHSTAEEPALVHTVHTAAHQEKSGQLQVTVGVH